VLVLTPSVHLPPLRHNHRVMCSALHGPHFPKCVALSNCQFVPALVLEDPPVLPATPRPHPLPQPLLTLNDLDCRLLANWVGWGWRLDREWVLCFWELIALFLDLPNVLFEYPCEIVFLSFDARAHLLQYGLSVFEERLPFVQQTGKTNVLHLQPCRFVALSECSFGNLLGVIGV
jgi:hypothetical protein